MSTIKEVYLFCKRELDAGHGDFKLYQGFDADCGTIDVNVNGAKYWDYIYKYIRLADSYLNDTHSMFRDHESFVDCAEEQYEKNTVSSQS